MKSILFTVLFFLSLGFATPAAFANEPIREWTFLSYANGKNNLEKYILGDVNEMESVGSNDQMNLLVEVGRKSTKNVVRMKLEKDANLGEIRSPILQDLGNSDMGDWRNVVEFVKWGMQNYPAKHYFLVIGDHGSGWHDRVDLNRRTRALSHDDLTRHFINTNQLGLMAANIKKVLGKKLDIFAADACLMAMAEISGELWDSADLFIGSQELEPGLGWDYISFIGGWSRNPGLSLEEIGRLAVRTYLQQYSNAASKNEATLSAVNLNEIPALAAHLKIFASALTSNRRNPTIMASVRKAISDSKHFYNPDYVDLTDFLRHLHAAKLLDPEWTRKYVEIEKRVVLANGSNLPAQNANGVSIWLPGNRSVLDNYASQYANLRFTRGTDWLATLKAIHAP